MGLKKPNKGGIDTSDATATAFNIESPYTAYIKGKKTEGSLYAFDDSTTTPANMDYANNKLSHVFRSKRIQNAGSKINIDLSSLTGSAARVMEGDTVITKDGVTTGTHVCDGTVLPSLSNPATAQEIVQGYEAINQNGEIIIGTHVCKGVTSNYFKLFDNDIEFTNSAPTIDSESASSLMFGTNNNNYVIGNYYLFNNFPYIGRITAKTAQTGEYAYKVTVKLFNLSATSGGCGRYPNVYEFI